MSYLGESIDFSINAVGKIKRNRKIYPPKDERDGLVKINLGCGLRVAKGWLNIEEKKYTQAYNHNAHSIIQYSPHHRYLFLFFLFIFFKHLISFYRVANY